MGKDWYCSQLMSWVPDLSHEEEVCYVVAAYPYATSPCRIRRPTQSRPDIEPEDYRSLHRSAPTLNTLGSGSIVLGASRAAFYNAMPKRRQ
jgi:hypothetical protein